MTSAADVVEPDVADRPGEQHLHDRWVLFQVTWAAAVLFHLAGNPTLAPQWGRALLGAAAVVAIVRPRSPWTAVPLAAAVVVNVWLEAPVLGNHWLLHGFVALLVVGAAVAGGGRPDRSMSALLGPARLTLLAFYAFAAFAKLNSDFFEPAVSCAVYYLRESAGSWGIGLDVGRPAGLAVAVLVAAVELSVPVLLVLRRTRHLGVVVALAFHYVLAVDRGHQFADFSSLLLALFLLFLAPQTASALVDEVRTAGRWVAERVDPGLARTACAGALVGLVVYASGPPSWGAGSQLPELAVFAWLVYGAVSVVVVAGVIRRRPGTQTALAAERTAPLLLLVPALALVNGLTPYLELRSSAGWNMYANLAVVDGESNHYLVRRGLPLSDVHERLVRITHSTDRSLDVYVDSPWLVPERQLLDHLADREDASVSGTVDGEPVRYEGATVAGRPEWQQKLQVFRAVDAEGPTSCQPSFGPAR